MDYPQDFAVGRPRHSDVYPFIDPRASLKGVAQGKIVLVTGAGTGIGKAIAEQFAIAGASSVIIAGRRSEPLEETKTSIELLAPSCRVLVRGGTDVADKASVKNLMDSLPEVPDILVHSAAVSLSTAAIDESNPDWWLGDIDNNIRGMYMITTAYLGALKEAGKTKARIINVGSIASWRYVYGRSSYAASKVAMNTFTEYIDREQQAGGNDIRCVVMHPGGVLTDLIKNTVVPEAIIGRMTDKAELSGATAVYLSTDRSNFLMGRFVLATWDMEELEQQKDKILKEDLLKTRVMGVEWRDGF
ncbi:short chain dehydrogenase domain-containing protein [Trichoderma breve]|uniref:Short chain dehydrogenase domain-containing protein n=1 Tax=Trichoderma breve TaxID=2034170 RepID=A0A9W9BJN0_9HYPO|nr:short chain dehydrogenase domain-containing protein [Trichoderma breve]KAJ4861570.1 short chain dehydrogenase domain-containing protein [Trichoderma breve]